jgi:hypothetical protein
MKRNGRIVAHSLVITECHDPACGPHFVGLDRFDNPICELVMAHDRMPVLIAELQKMYDRKIAEQSH